MSLYWAFLLVVGIWSTTPLAIQFSTLGASFNFGVAARMLLGLVICLAILSVKRESLVFSPKINQHYVYAGLGIFVTMSLVYFAAQYIPSGMISVVFGLTPIVTGIFAYLLLSEAFYRWHKILGLILGILGLLVIFQHSISYDPSMNIGLISLTLAMAFQAFIAVKLKQINAHISALHTTTGALLVSIPLFLISWLITDHAQLPEIVTPKALWSIGYLALFGSVIGFMAYYHLIRHASVKTVGLIPLITPVFALILGNLFNQESLSLLQLSGIILVLIGLGIYEYGNRKLWIRKSST